MSNHQARQNSLKLGTSGGAQNTLIVLLLNLIDQFSHDYFSEIHRVGCGGELNVRRERDGSSQSVLVGTTKEVSSK